MGENREFRLFSDNIRKNVYIYEPCTVIQSQDTRYFEIFYSYYYTQSSLISRIFRKSNYQITEMEQQVLKAIDHIKYVSKKGVTMSGIQRFLKKSLPPPLMKPLWGKLYVKCKKMAKLTTNCESYL